MLSFIFISKSSQDILPLKQKKIRYSSSKTKKIDIQFAHCIYQTAQDRVINQSRFEVLSSKKLRYKMGKRGASSLVLWYLLIKRSGFTELGIFLLICIEL